MSDPAVMSNQLQVLDWAIRNDADAWTVQYFAGRYDPYWRAVFIESLLRLMRDRPAVGAGAADASGMDAFAGEQYVHGNVARGLVAAGVNELAMHCEDLFSVVRAVHADRGFALGVVNYSAGKTTGLAPDCRRAGRVGPQGAARTRRRDGRRRAGGSGGPGEGGLQRGGRRRADCRLVPRRGALVPAARGIAPAV